MDAQAEVDEAVATYLERHPHKTKGEAVRAVCTANPELRERWVAEHNEKYGEAVRGRRR